MGKNDSVDKTTKGKLVECQGQVATDPRSGGVRKSSRVRVESTRLKDCVRLG